MINKLLYKIADRLAECTVVLSYSSIGYKIRQRLWDPGDLDVDLEGKVMIVTGANSGIGKAVSLALAERKATVVMACRNPDRGRRAMAEVHQKTGNDRAALEIVDISDLDQVRAFAERIRSTYDRLDVLINNAGALLDTRQLTPQSFEVTFATHVLGPFLLTHLLLPLLERSAPARIIHVTSGGMYTQRLHLDDLQYQKQPYDGVLAYARAKRAQVDLNQQWAAHLAGSGVTSNCMHPGWAATPGVSSSLPTFNRIMGPILRDSNEGADTVVWLAVADQVKEISGELWLDRFPRMTAVFPGTKTSDSDQRRLWETCRELTGLDG